MITPKLGRKSNFSFVYVIVLHLFVLDVQYTLWQYSQRYSLMMVWVRLAHQTVDTAQIGV